MMDINDFIVHFDRIAKKIVRTEPPQLKDYINRIGGTDIWLIPTVQNLCTGTLFNISMIYADGEYQDESATPTQNNPPGNNYPTARSL